jgi:hypothetical protein
MKTFENIAAQGDLLIRRIDELPSDVEQIKTNQPHYIVAHSETGHNHVIDATPKVRAYHLKRPDIYQLFLQVDEPVEIKHLRSFHTHETLRVPAGTFEIRRQREYTPEGFRRAAD